MLNTPSRREEGAVIFIWRLRGSKEITIVSFYNRCTGIDANSTFAGALVALCHATIEKNGTTGNKSMICPGFVIIELIKKQTDSNTCTHCYMIIRLISFSLGSPDC